MINIGLIGYEAPTHVISVLNYLGKHSRHLIDVTVVYRHSTCV